MKDLSRRNSLTASLLILALPLIATISLPFRATAASSQTLVALTNAERTANGLKNFSWNADLSSSAWQKAKDMCSKNYWAHTAPDGVTGWDFMTKAGYSYQLAGENLAKDFLSDQALVAGWMASPSHRANILKAAFNEVGIASFSCTLLGEATTVVVAHYGTRQTAAPKPTSRPATAVTAPNLAPKAPAETAGTAAKYDLVAGIKNWLGSITSWLNN